MQIVYSFDKVEYVNGKKIGKKKTFIFNYQIWRYAVALFFEHMFMHEIKVLIHKCASFQ